MNGEHDDVLDAKRRVLDEILEYALGATADEMKSRHAPAPAEPEAPGDEVATEEDPLATMSEEEIAALLASAGSPEGGE